MKENKEKIILFRCSQREYDELFKQKQKKGFSSLSKYLRNQLFDEPNQSIDYLKFQNQFLKMKWEVEHETNHNKIKNLLNEFYTHVFEQ